MTTQEVNEILKNVQDTPNSDLLECKEILYKEFEIAKQQAIDMTRHLDAIIVNFHIIDKEINKRKR